jgi:hypothetical protein
VEALSALTMIGFFTPYEWLQTEHQGRILIALLYLKQNPQKVDNEIREYLQSIYFKLHITLQHIVEEILGELQ